MTDLPRGVPIASQADTSSANATGQIVAWVYARSSTAEAMQAKVLTLDKARRIATNIARSPELLKRDE